MHEFSLVQKEVERIKTSVNGKKVSKVVFHLGRLAHGTPDSISQAFKVITVNTPLSNADFHIVSIEPEAKCLSCGKTISAKGTIGLKCVNCGSDSSELISGDECFISSVEVEN